MSNAPLLPAKWWLRPEDFAGVIELDGKRIDLIFESEDVAEVIIPNDDDLGVTIIHEVAGRVSVEGRVSGELVAFSSPSIFEFLGD